jgi:protein-tyrosine phosphatase/membrane-associated phospholipid phosphatase
MTDRRPWGTALLWTVLLSLEFLVVYGLTNSFTATRTDVGVLYFEWERLIPFVPLMIIPYMSIDLFFIGAPFLCRSRAEIHVLAKRIAFATVAAGIFFLLIPLRLAFARPETDGVIGATFNLLTSFDRPHNLLPSLHITFRTILWVIYVRYTSGLARLGVQVWFLLIGISTILTFQHHVVDVAGGLILAMICFYLFPEARQAGAGNRNPKIGAIYAIGSAVCLASALIIGPWGLILTWPAFALAMVSAGYFGLGPGVLRKSEGRRSLSMRILLAPYLLGIYLRLLWYRRKTRPFDEVVPGLLIGRRLRAKEARRVDATAVLDLTAEHSECTPFLSLPYKNVQIMDLTLPTREQLREAVEFVTGRMRSGTVYVHCAIGYSRSAAVAAATLLELGQAGSPEEAIDRVRRARPEIVVPPGLIEILKDFAPECAEASVRLTGV